mgnify:CR=1 FL=1
MRVLIDECIDWRLSRELGEHDVKTARQMGWETIKNGELLALASREFDAFVTVDRNLSFQQNVRQLSIAVFVLRARTNRLADLLPLAPDLVARLAVAMPGRSPTCVESLGNTRAVHSSASLLGARCRST